MTLLSNHGKSWNSKQCENIHVLPNNDLITCIFENLLDLQKIVFLLISFKKVK